MSFWKYKHKEGDEDIFYLFVIPFIPIMMIFTFYFQLIQSKFRASKSMVKKLFFPVFVLFALLPCFAIPALTVITFDAWIVKYTAYKRYTESAYRTYFVARAPAKYYFITEEISANKLTYYKSNGYEILDVDESRDWYEKKNSWNASFANPLYLFGGSLGLNLPLLFAFLVESWLGWVFKKEQVEKEEHFDQAA